MEKLFPDSIKKERNIINENISFFEVISLVDKSNWIGVIGFCKALTVLHKILITNLHYTWSVKHR